MTNSDSAVINLKFLCKVDDVASDAVREVSVDGERKICVVNAGGSFFACQPRCPHEGVALCEGCVDGTTLTCLEHLWQWDLRDGSPLGLAEKPLEVFPVQVDGGSIYLAD